MHRFLRAKMIQVSATLSVLIIMAPLYAQVITGAISGTVTDANGAAVVGASVVVTNQDTDISIKTATDGSGFYTVEGLPDGAYSVDVTKTGFQETIRKGIHLTPGQRFGYTVALQVGSASSSITVSSETAVEVNTETAESGGTISEKQINNLMLNGRNFQGLAAAIPGVVSYNGADSLSGSNVAISINGANNQSTNFSIDGIYDMQTGNYDGINVTPVVEGITEFKIMSDNYSAKYGILGSGEVEVETKSGTDTLHGSAWDYLRNDFFDADNYFSTAKQALHQNIYGYTFGGPIVIPGILNRNRTSKTYFFLLNQWHEIHPGVVEQGAVFPAAMRSGNFSNSPTLPSSGKLTLDQNSTNLLASADKTNCIQGNTTINSTCFDPVAVALLADVQPLPNNTAAGFLNYLNQGSIIETLTDYQYRLDQYVSKNELLIVRYMWEPALDVYPYDTRGGTPYNTVTDRESLPSFNTMARLQSTITGHLLNIIGIAETWDKPVFSSDKGASLPSGVSIVQAFPNAPTMNRIPNISISKSWSGFGVGAEPLVASDGEGMLSDDLSWVKGSHVLQAGALYIAGIKRQTVQQIPQGTFTFSGVHTGDPAADFLLGLDASYTQSTLGDIVNTHYRQGEAYFQDDWKAARRLTLNLGVRYQYFSNDTDSGDALSSFNPALFNASQAPVVNPNGTLRVNSSNQPVTSGGQVANLLNGIVIAGQGGYNSGFFVPKKLNFGPRVGFAYDVFGNQKTSARGGFGMGYERIPVSNAYNASGQNIPFSQSADILNSTLSDAVAGTAGAPTVSTLDQVPLTFRPSYVETYSLTVEHELTGNMIASLGYAGSASRHLSVLDNNQYDINFALPVTAPSVSGCALAANQSPSASYQFDPCINTGETSANYTRPYAGYGVIRAAYQDGTASYNALEASLKYVHRASQLTVAYTYSNDLSNIGVRTGGSGSAQTSTVQNPRNYHAEYGPVDQDLPNVLTATWVYAIPGLHQAPEVLRPVINGWSFSGLFDHQSGYALSAGMSTSTAGLATRPNQIAPQQKVGTLKEWFNTASYAAPAYGFFGDAANGTIRGPGYTSGNVALRKAFPIKARLVTDFQAEAYNVLNHPSFEAVSTAVGAGTYGQVTSASNQRIMEFMLKLQF